MKCINMKIVEILFFIANFVVINSSVVGQVKTTTVTNEEILKNKFRKECPHLMKIVTAKNLEDYTINCKAPNTTILEEFALQQACFVVKNMFIGVCNKKLNETYLDLLGRSNTMKICPFSFYHLNRSLFENYEQVKELEQESFCQKVCYDLYSTKIQCILLSKFNNYLKTPSTPARLEVDKSPVSTQKTGETSAKQPSEEHHQSNQFPQTKTNQSTNQFPQTKTNQSTNQSTQPKPITTKTKTENVSSQLTESAGKVTKIAKKEKKTENPIMSSTPKEDIRTAEEAEAPKIDMKSFEPNNDEPISKNEEDKLTDEELSNEDNFLPRENPAFNKELKEKDSYVGEGFSQPEDSHFFFYFIMVSSLVVVGYLAFHNKNKILAYALEGSSSRRSRRRPNPARYRKLETNLEEAISSSAATAATSSVVY